MQFDPSDIFNQQDYETRTLNCGLHMEIQIRCLEREKERLKNAYNKSLVEINAHIKNIKESLIEWDTCMDAIKNKGYKHPTN